MPQKSTVKSDDSWTRWKPERKARLLRHLSASRYWSDPAAWVSDCIEWPEGEKPLRYQLDALSELVEYGRVCERGPHGLGKTSTAAFAVLWFADTRDALGKDWKTPTTASKWRQLEEYLWPDIHKWARRLRWERLGRRPFTDRELLDLSLNLETGTAFALASNEAANIEGAHADHLLWIYDEAKSIPDAIFDASEGALAGAGGDTGREAYAFAFSTPGEPTGRFYAIHAKQSGFEDWKTRHVTVDEAIAAGRVSQSWVASRARQWGRSSAVFKNRVLGEFASSDTDSVIPLEWVERANERWERAVEAGWPPVVCYGVDVADGGEDQTVIAVRNGDAISEIRRPPPGDTMITAGHVASLLNAYQGVAVVDAIGVGAGVVARLREQGFRVEPFNAAEGTKATDVSGELEFANKSAAAWWGLRDRLNPAHAGEVALPADDLLTGDLTAPKWRVSSSGKILIESKDEIRKRLARSTDTGDAVVMAFWQTNTPARVSSARGRQIPRLVGGRP
jgi:hypothetical protein